MTKQKCGRKSLGLTTEQMKAHREALRKRREALRRRAERREVVDILVRHIMATTAVFVNRALKVEDRKEAEEYVFKQVKRFADALVDEIVDDDTLLIKRRAKTSDDQNNQNKQNEA